MTGPASPVYFLPTEDGPGGAPAVTRDGCDRLAAALDLSPKAPPAGPWAVKVDIGGSHRRAPLDPDWVRALTTRLGGGVIPPGSFACDTLSITTAALATADSHLALAEAKGFGGAEGPLPYLVADDPARGPSQEVPLAVDAADGSHPVAAALRGMANLCVLTPVRPHPHLGFSGALISLGAGLSDRAGKIALHRSIRPRVDTPLCAGCGSCLTVCLFDAIKLKAGRAFIDHTLCTGCGECMNVCFMAGIAPEETQGIGVFQARVAATAAATRAALCGVEPRRQLYGNFLGGHERRAGGTRVRRREPIGEVGMLLSRDPVALDQATYDLIVARNEGRFDAWSGFSQVPATLLAKAAEVGLGQSAYSLVTV